MNRKKIAVTAPEEFYIAALKEAQERGCEVEQACAELYCEGLLIYRNLVEKYQPEYLVNTWHARLRVYEGEAHRWTFDVNEKRAQAVHDLANDHNMVTPDMNACILAAGLWGDMT